MTSPRKPPITLQLENEMTQRHAHLTELQLARKVAQVKHDLSYHQNKFRHTGRVYLYNGDEYINSWRFQSIKERKQVFEKINKLYRKNLTIQIKHDNDNVSIHNPWTEEKFNASTNVDAF